MGHERACHLQKMKDPGFFTVHITHGTHDPPQRGLGKGLPSTDFQDESCTSFSSLDSEALDCPSTTLAITWPSGVFGAIICFLGVQAVRGEGVAGEEAGVLAMANHA